MLDLEKIATCLDVTDDHIRDVLSAAKSLSEPGPRERSLALLRRMVAIAQPGTGAPRMLVLLARMAKRDWIEGDLIVRLIGDTELSVLELLVDDGASRERIAGPLRIDVPLGELVDAVDKNAAQFLPLVASDRTDRRLELRGKSDYFAQHRKASISAFAFGLKAGLELPEEKSTSEPARNKPPPPPRRPGR